MPRFICTTCGTQHADSPTPPEQCVICTDERQFVGWNGQGWTTHEELASGHKLLLGGESGLLTLRIAPDFAIDQRSLLLPTDAGNILWESQCLVTDEAVAAIRERGGLDRIIVSHPHFYSSMGEWSDAFGGVPILIHEADLGWVQRPHPAIHTWSGDILELSRDVTLIRCGGHFPGSTALHWATGPRPGGALFPGDALQVARDRRSVAFLFSYPNMVPMKSSDIRAMRDRLSGFGFRDVLGYSAGRNILGNGRMAVDASFARHLDAVAG